MNQYFGDANDYYKYGLLRILSNGRNCRTGICWMLTPDDGSIDSGIRKYLEQPDKWRKYDSGVFDCLRRAHADIGAVQGRGIFSNEARNWAETLSDKTRQRQEYFNRMGEALRGRDLIFFDPDKGHQVRSRPYGGGLSSKYLYWDELVHWFRVGCSLLIYQHFPQERRNHFINRMAKQIHDHTEARPIYAIRTFQTVFFLAPQARHAAHSEKGFIRLLAWGSQTLIQRDFDW